MQSSPWDRNQFFVETSYRRRGSRRHARTGAAGALVALVAAVMLMASTLFAGATGIRDHSVFELDGDVLVNQGQGGGDWETIYSGGADTLGDTGIVADPDPSGNTTYFTEGDGSKDFDDVPTWVYASDMGGVPDKDEITNAFAAAYAKDGELRVYFGLDRYANNGTAELGFWFFQDPGVALNPPDATKKESFQGEHKVGDVLVLAQFPSSGKIGYIRAFEWVGFGNGTVPHPQRSLRPLGEGVDCADATADTKLCGIINNATTTTPWDYQAKLPSGIAPKTYPAGSLFEGGINISRLFDAPEGRCFANFMAVSRASDSVEAMRKDFVLGALQVCDARIKIDPPEAANQVGDPHDFEVTVEKRDDSTGYEFGPAGNVLVTVKIEDGPGHFLDADGEPIAGDETTCTTANDGKCTVKLGSPGVGLTEVSARADVALPGHTKSVRTDGQAGNSGPAVKRWVDAKLTLEEDGVNRVGQAHTFTATLEFHRGDDNGWVPSPNGQTIAFEIVGDGVGTLSAPSCETAGGTGSCSITHNSPGTGITTVRASWEGVIVTGHGTADPVVVEPRTATKRWVDVGLDLTPPEAANRVNDAHKFTAALTFDYGFGVGFEPAPAGETITFTLEDKGSFVDGIDSCETDADGRCDIFISSSETGLSHVTAYWDGEIDAGAMGETSSEEAMKRWVDATLELTPPEATNHIGDTHTFTATLRIDRGDGQGLQLADDELITFVKTGDGGELSASECTTGATGLGECEVTLDSSEVGTSNVTAGWDGVIRAETDVEIDLEDSAIKHWIELDAYIEISPDGVNRVGDPHTFEVTVHRKSPDTGHEFAPASGVEVTVGRSGPGNFIDQNDQSLGDTATCTTGGSGTCEIRLVSAVTGISLVSASADIEVYDGIVLSRPTDGVAPNSGPASKRWVDAALTLTPDGVNQVGDDHTFTAHLQIDDGSGGGLTDAAGATIALEKTAGPGELSASSCETGSDGTCEVTLSSEQTGVSTVRASWTGLVDGATVVVTPATADKRWVDARLSLTPAEDTNHVSQPHTFTALLEFDHGNHPEGENPVWVPAPGEEIEFGLSGPGELENDSCVTDEAGECDVVLTTDETGVSTVQASWSGMIETAEANVAPKTAVKRWVDAQIVINPPVAANQVGEPHEFTIFVGEQRSGVGGPAFTPAGGVTVTAEILAGGVGEFLGGVNTCVTATAGDGVGTCKVTVVSEQTGLTVVSASAGVLVEGELVTVATDGQSGNSGSAEKLWIDAALTLESDGANQVGRPHTFTAHLQIDHGDGEFVDAEGKTVLFSKTGPGVLNATSCTTGEAGTCSVVLNSADTGLTTVTAGYNEDDFDTVTHGTTSLAADPAEGLKRWVDAALVVTPPTATNVLGDTHTFTASLSLDRGDGAGFEAAGAGELIRFARISGPGTLASDTCTTGGGGTCTVNLTSGEVGLTRVGAAWAGEIATAQGDAEAEAFAPEAVKQWVNPAITIVKTAAPDAGPPRDVTYTYLVTNIGDVTLAPVRVTDDVLGDIGLIPSLVPGQSATLETTRFVNVDSPLRNVGTACGDPVVDGAVIGPEVCATDDAVISVVLGAPPLQVAPQVLPRTGGGIHLLLLLSAQLLWLAAATLVAQRRLLNRLARRVR